jgi:uncharacterized damage-inducible protein DinB
MSAGATQTTPDLAATRAIADYLIADFAREMQTTLGVIRAVPEGNLSYTPDPKSKTALGLVRHLALEDEWLLNSVADGKMGPFADESDACGIMNPTDGASRYETKVTAALDRVRAMSEEELARIIDFFGFMQLPAVNVLGLAIKHSIHHRGQLSAYLRAAGGKVPGIYGPSADTQ